LAVELHEKLPQTQMQSPMEELLLTVLQN